MPNKENIIPLPIGTELYFRNASTGKPTLIHIWNNENKGAFCGFKSFAAQNKIVDMRGDYTYKSLICKKCLKSLK